MSDIPYSVRDKSTRVNAIKGFNFDSLFNDELFKKKDANNLTGTKVLSFKSPTINGLALFTDQQFPTQVGVIQGEIVGGLEKLSLNTTGDVGDGMTITSQGRVGIGITEPEEDLEVDGSIQIDSSNVSRLKFQKSGQSPHALGEIDGEEDGTNGGDLQFYTKEDGGSVTEKLRINNQGALGLGGANYGLEGQVLVSNGSAALPSWQIPYHLVFGLADSGGSGIFVTTASTTVVYNTLYVVTGESPTTTYNTDLVSSTTWNPSVSGIFQINFHALIRSINQDYLVESTISIQKLVSGSWSNVAGSNDRRWGASVNEADARAFTNTNNIAHSFNVSSGDSFRFTINGRSYLGNNIWTLTGQDVFRISITRIA